jgi:hypothetical protein
LRADALELFRYLDGARIRILTAWREHRLIAAG